MRIRKAILKSTLRIINLLTIQTECYHDVPCMICRELLCRFIVDNNLLHRKSQSTLVEFDPQTPMKKGFFHRCERFAGNG